MTQPARTPLLLFALMVAAAGLLAVTLRFGAGAADPGAALARPVDGVVRGPARGEAADLAAETRSAPGAPGPADRSALVVATQGEGAGTIRARPAGPQVVGRLLASSGEPINGAQVSFTTRRSDLPLGYDLDLGFSLGLESDPAPSASELRRWEIAQAETGPGGHFEIPSGEDAVELQPGAGLEALVRAPGWAVYRAQERRMPSELPLDVGGWTMEPGAVVSGRVVGPDGEPQAGVRLSFGQPFARGAASRTVPSRGIPLGVTGDAGEFRIDELRSGEFYLVAESRDHPTVRFEGSARPDAPLERVTIRLQRGGTLGGRIEGAPKGLPLLVEARQVEVDSGRDEDRRPRYATVDLEEQTFVVTGLVQGEEVQLRALWGPRGTAPRSGESPSGASREAGSPVRELETQRAFPGKDDLVMAWSARRSVTGRVMFLDPKSGERRPLESYIVSAAAEPVEGTEFDARPLEGTDGPQLSHPGGRFVYGDLPLRRNASQAAFRVRAPGFGDLVVRNVPLPPGEAVDVGDWVLEPAPSLMVTVTDEDSGDFVEGARLYLVSVSKDRWFERWWKRDEPAWSSDTVRYGETGAQGVVRLPLPAGGTPWKLGVQADGFVRPEPVILGSAVETYALEIARGASLRVVVRDPDGSPLQSAAVQVGPQRDRRGRPTVDLPSLSGRTGDDGQLVFSALPHGLYEVRGIAPGMSSVGGRGRAQAFNWPRARVEVPKEGQVEAALVLPHRVRVEGVVLQGGAPLKGARVAFYVKAGAELMQPNFSSQELRAITDESGAFALSSVPAGEYLAGVTHESRAMVTLLELEVFPPREAAHLDPYVLDLPDASVAGRVVFQGTDRPVPGARVQVVGQDGHPEAYVGTSVLRERMDGGFQNDDRWEQPGRTRTDARGEFELRGVSPGVALRLTVSGDLLLRRRLNLEGLGEGDAHGDLRIEVGAAARVVVELDRVGDATSRRRRRNSTRVVMERLDKDGAPVENQRRNEQGRRSVTFRSIRPGTYRIQTFGPGSGSGADPADSKVVELGGGDDLRLGMRGD